MTYKEVSRAIIYDHKNHFLLAKRGRGNGHGQWALVGGKPEKGENAQQAIIREVLEEVGLTFKPTQFKQEISSAHDPDGYTWKVDYFSGQATGELQLDPAENTEAQYFSRADLESLEIAFGHLRIIDEFLNQPKPPGD